MSGFDGISPCLGADFCKNNLIEPIEPMEPMEPMEHLARNRESGRMKIKNAKFEIESWKTSPAGDGWDLAEIWGQKYRDQDYFSAPIFLPIFRRLAFGLRPVGGGGEAQAHSLLAVSPCQAFYAAGRPGRFPSCGLMTRNHTGSHLITPKKTFGCGRLPAGATVARREDPGLTVTYGYLRRKNFFGHKTKNTRLARGSRLANQAHPRSAGQVGRATRGREGLFVRPSQAWSCWKFFEVFDAAMDPRLFWRLAKRALANLGKPVQAWKLNEQDRRH